ncbi:hypothetical protein WA1_02670 [Scytonema hofmannii PCC 7110]|uniref:Alpha/beta hydrolase n=1 Tax=Scytonema hofmannii PCC 7110 TaxID=128403 RepID=A0A139XHD6_9CYAN|nr:hypothetical protein [Scytonema hofmannii]KYC44063.1 hypothetical protein WA1_02670 [Scytonema hofmannii PCC 7110]
MNIILCPGIHEHDLTQSFVSEWRSQASHESANGKPVDILIVPTNNYSTLSPFHIFQFLHECLKNRLESPVVFISFSAGVVGAIVAAHMWQIFGGRVKAFIAIDGWGVPLWGHFPIHRMSHDYFTHWSSSLLGSGQNNFYAAPSVDHLAMWRSPNVVRGYWVNSSSGDLSPKQRLSASEFLHLQVLHYEEN